MIYRIVADRYRLGDVLAESEPTTVYEAVDLHLRRTVAIKLLNTDAAGDPELVERFLEDARRAASLVHPNIAATYDVGTENGVPYAVSEQVEGERLSYIISDSAPLKPDRIRHLGSQLAAALDYAQRHDGVEYSVDSNQVLVSAGDRVKILGLRSERTSPGRNGTADRFRAGEYRPRTGVSQHRDELTGVQSLGALLYEMATGRSPHRQNADWLPGDRNPASPVRPSSLNPLLPDVLERIVIGAMETGPYRRYRTIAELSLALQAQDILDGERTTVHPTSYPDRAGRRNDRYGGGPSAAAVLIPTLILAAVILGAIAVGTGFRPRLEMPEVASFVSGPNPQMERDQRTAQAASSDLEKAIATIRGNAQQVSTMVSGIHERLAAERAIVDGMRGLVEEMKRDASGSPNPAILATFAARRQSLDLSYGSLEAARANLDGAVGELESRLGPMIADATRAGQAADRLAEILDAGSARIQVQTAPGDEVGAISAFNASVENARQEVQSVRKAESDLFAEANSLRGQAQAMAISRPAPQATSTALPAPGPTSGRRDATPRPAGTPRPAATPAPNATTGPAVAPAATPTPSRPLERPTVAPAPAQAGTITISGRFAPLASQIAAQVGQATGTEGTDPKTGDVTQSTTGGMLIWKKATSRLYFTDGFATWVLGPNGLEFRHNDELLDWERASR